MTAISVSERLLEMAAFYTWLDFTLTLLLPSERSTRFGNPAWPGFKTANFAAFGAWSWVLPKNAESLRSSDALMRVAVPKASRPRWAA